MLIAQIRKKEAEIQELENKLVSAQNKMDDLKKQDVQIKDICLYGMYISEMEDQIRKKQEQLKLLQQQEEKKKVQVIAAKIDTSRYEKLKDRRQSEYEKAGEIKDIRRQTDIQNKNTVFKLRYFCRRFDNDVKICCVRGDTAVLAFDPYMYRLIHKPRADAINLKCTFFKAVDTFGRNCFGFYTTYRTCKV